MLIHRASEPVLLPADLDDTASECHLSPRVGLGWVGLVDRMLGNVQPEVHRPAPHRFGGQIEEPWKSVQSVSEIAGI